jgi:hypothetical protein
MLKGEPVLSVYFDFAIAIAAVYRSVIAGLEGYFRGFAALGAGCREHLASGTKVAAAVAAGTVATVSTAL